MGLIRVVLDLSTSNFFVLFFNFHQTGAVVHFFYLQGNRLSFFTRRGEVELPEVLVLTLPCTIDPQNRKPSFSIYFFVFSPLVDSAMHNRSPEPWQRWEKFPARKTGYRKSSFLKFICCLFFSPLLVDTLMDYALHIWIAKNLLT